MKDTGGVEGNPNKRSVFSSTEATLGFALACNIAWVSMSFKSLNFFAEYNHRENLLDTTYLISIIALVITLVLIGIFDKRVGEILGRTGLLVVSSLGVATSTLIMPLSGIEGFVGGVALISAGLTSGFFSAIYLIYLGMAFSQLSTRRIVGGAAFAFVFAKLIFALFLLFAPLESCVFAASMPIASMLLMTYAINTLPQTSHSSIISLEHQGDIKDPFERKDARRLLITIAAASVMIGFSNEVARTLYMQMWIADIDANSYAFSQAIMAFFVTGGAVLISLALLNVNNKSYFNMPKYCYRVLLISLILGAVLLPLPIIYPEMGISLPYTINATSYQCFGLFIWIITTGICHRYSSFRLRFFSFVRAAWALGPFFGILLGRYVVYNLGLSIQTVFPIMVVSVLAIVLASTTAFTENDLMNAIKVIPIERRRRFMEKCRKVIEKFGLSEREGEIMVMFAKGRNLAYIQDQLHLSRSTVSTHRQHIYQKIGIHSQQELLDIIDKMVN